MDNEKVCKVYKTFANGQQVGVVITLENNEIRATCKPGYEHLMENILDEPYVRENPLKGELEAISRESDPETWFYGLPEMISSSYIRAEIVGAEDEDEGVIPSLE